MPQVICPGCATPAEWTGTGTQRCPRCERSFLALVAAPAAPVPGAAAAPAMDAETATCFDHPTHAAVASCGECGRFLCQLCDIPLEDRHYCPACFSQAHQQHRLTSTRQHDTLYDSMAYALGWAWLVVYFTWPFALIAVGYLSIARWNAPRDYLVPRGRWRYVAAWAGLLILPAAIFFMIGVAAGARRAMAR